jgi:Tat protein translocase TatB subunit
MPSPPPVDAAIVTGVFGMGLTEILLVGVVILLLFSPKELPGVIKSVARVYGSIRRTAEDFRAQVMEADELREPIDEIREAYRGTKAELLQAQNAARRELARAKMEARSAEQQLTRLARDEAAMVKKSVSAAADSGAAPAVAATAAAATSPAATSPAPAGTTPAGRPGAAYDDDDDDDDAHSERLDDHSGDHRGDHPDTRGAA